MFEIANETLVARFAPLGARMCHVSFREGQNLILDADPATHPEWAASYGGVIVGPVANRVATAQVKIGEQHFAMDANEGVNCLHSGPNGMHTRTWHVTEQSNASVTFAVSLPDNACGLPGRREISAAFALHAECLDLTITATSDQITPMAMAHHPYWALGGPHILQCDADRYLPVDDALIPTGAVAAVAGTDFDFARPRVLPQNIDHNLCWSGDRNLDAPMATLHGQNAVMEIWSNQPGLQVYSGAGLPNLPGITPFAGCALEPQNWPNAVNTAHFPSALLQPHTSYHYRVRYRFLPAS
ncbi:MAG: aldose epimerase family protein [Pseudomonadota bacterium]